MPPQRDGQLPSQIHLRLQLLNIQGGFFTSSKCWRWQNPYQKSESKGISQRKYEVLTQTFTFLVRILPAPTLRTFGAEPVKKITLYLKLRTSIWWSRKSLGGWFNPNWALVQRDPSCFPWEGREGGQIDPLNWLKNQGDEERAKLPYSIFIQIQSCHLQIYSIPIFKVFSIGKIENGPVF